MYPIHRKLFLLFYFSLRIHSGVKVGRGTHGMAELQRDNGESEESKEKKQRCKNRRYTFQGSSFTERRLTSSLFLS